MRSMALVAAGLFMACSDVRLEPPQEDVTVATVDNLLTLTGSFCTSQAGDVKYPVKIMFVVDGSGSLQFSDQNRQRVVAVEETINALIGIGNTYFKVVVFNASVKAKPEPVNGCGEPVFTNKVADLTAALDNLAVADTLTDYQGALALTYQELNRDMGCTLADPLAGPAELGRTKYVVIFISDGMPDPECTIGVGNDFDPVNVNADGSPAPYLICESSNFVNCILKRQGTVCDSGQYGTCGTAAGCAYNDQQPYCCDQGVLSESLFGGTSSSELEGGNDYNQPYQILQKVSDIMDLQDRYQVGDLRVHAGLIMDPLADPNIIAIFGDAAQAAPLMKQIADVGNGQYMEFYGGDQIDFLSIDFEAIKQQRVVRDFFADNRSARLRTNGLEPDTDLDGLTDSEEVALRTDPTMPDTDGDGYSDLVESRLSAFAFNPKDDCYPPVDDSSPVLSSSLPARSTACNTGDVVNGVAPRACRGGPVFCGIYYCDADGFLDQDRDGLRDCEELALGTDPTLPDTDRDGIPDLQEVTYGLDPLRWDANSDADKDGVPNAIEVEWHLNPIVQQSEDQIRDRYRYHRPQTGTTVDGRSCYDFQVRGVQMAYTLHSRALGFPADPKEVGYNEIRLYILENMADNLAGEPLIRTACVRTQYIPPSLKAPSTGEIVLQESNFKYLGSQEDDFRDKSGQPPVQFNAQTDCIMAR